jgi:nucleoside-diphosphate kinase
MANGQQTTDITARALSTVPARQAPRFGVLAATTAVAGFAAYELSKTSVKLEGAKTVAGEKGTVSERSFVMVRLMFATR